MQLQARQLALSIQMGHQLRNQLHAGKPQNTYAQKRRVRLFVDLLIRSFQHAQRHPETAEHQFARYRDTAAPRRTVKQNTIKRRLEFFQHFGGCRLTDSQSGRCSRQSPNLNGKFQQAKVSYAQPIQAQRTWNHDTYTMLE